jgi:galactokinase/mevalonate kinase-like predicted kinase
VISAEMDTYTNLEINATFTDDYLLKYSIDERVRRIDEIKRSRNNGAPGAKLICAGAGGFLLFYAEESRYVQRAMTGAGPPEVRIDLDGSVVLAWT